MFCLISWMSWLIGELPGPHTNNPATQPQQHRLTLAPNGHIEATFRDIHGGLNCGVAWEW